MTNNSAEEDADGPLMEHNDRPIIKQQSTTTKNDDYSALPSVKVSMVGQDGRTVLKGPDVSDAHSRKKQFLAAFFATLGCFINGTAVSYTATSIPSLVDRENGTNIFGQPFSLDMQDVSWLVSLLSIGSFFGCLLAGLTMEKLGRRRSLLLVTGPLHLIGYVCIILAVNKYTLNVGRFCNGLGLGSELATVAVYIMEIASTDIRGLLGCLIQLMIALGITFSYVAGAWLDNWVHLALVNSLWNVPFFLGLLFVIPESPRFLVTRGHEYSAVKSLEWLRGRGAHVDLELDQIKRDIALKRSKRSSSILQLGSAWKPFLVSTALIMCFSFCGANVMIFYTAPILEHTGNTVSLGVSSLLISVVIIGSAILAFFVVARLNRKGIMMISALAMAGFQVTLAMCAYQQEQKELLSHGVSPSNESLQEELPVTSKPGGEVDEDYPLSGWVPVLSLLGYVLAGNLGFMSLIFVVPAELLPAHIRGVAQAFTTCFMFVGGFICAKTFVDLVGALNYSGTIGIYAGVCCFATLVIALFVPETCNRNEEQIQRDFSESCLQFRCRDFCRSDSA